MSIRSNAITWLSTHHKNASGIVVTTKYYTPEQSWPKKHVWWPTVSKQKIETTADKYIISFVKNYQQVMIFII